MLASSVAAGQEASGSIRGVVYDKDFDAPLRAAKVTIVDTGQEATTTDQGNYVLRDVAPGAYTLVFSKEGYYRQVRSGVVVASARLTEVNLWLSGDFAEMEEFVVQDIQIGGGTEAQLLELRFDSPAMMDSISAELMSRAGASDAASALRLVAGASVEGGKFAVIRGLPDRYVSNQLNSVRLPTADEDKRAVELDQFPAAVIESVQVTKTFTPDQQGDASGGAVNIKLKGIPEEKTFNFSFQLGQNTQVAGEDGFLTYDGGGVNLWGRDDGSRDPQLDSLGENWDGAVGVATIEPPTDFKWAASGGGKHRFNSGMKVGGFASVFYERDSSFYDNGVDDSLVLQPGNTALTPQFVDGADQSRDARTALFDVTKATESVQWGLLGTLGAETENHKVDLAYLYTHTAEDSATLAIDTRGKETFFPGYDINDPMSEGNLADNLEFAPQIRNETLRYTERSTRSVQLHGEHTLPTGNFGFFRAPVLDWTIAESQADLYQPDKRQFGSVFFAESFDPVDGETAPATWRTFKPSANFTLGNLQRIFKSISEESSQHAVNLRFPFLQWDEELGFLKVGVFDDDVKRSYDEDTFTNREDNSSFQGGFDEPWSGAFPFEDNHNIEESFLDIDYEGTYDVTAWYSMLDLPLSPSFELVGGARFEKTRIGIFNEPEQDPGGTFGSTFFAPGAASDTRVFVDPETGLTNADAQFAQNDALPAAALIYEVSESVTLRASYAETVARQTFKELTPILQQEFLGGPIFVGNPELRMSSLENYDLRVDYTPNAGSLLSASIFYKDVTDPIEYIQRPLIFTFTTPVNYPEGELKGVELEARQDLGIVWESLEGVGLGANATFLSSEVTLTDGEVAEFQDLGVDLQRRRMTNAPDHLYNLYATYDIPDTGSQFGLFYTMQGETLRAGAGEAENLFVPSVFQDDFDTLNFSFSQRLGGGFRLKFQAKNLTNPAIRDFYSSPVTEDATRRSFTRGIEYSISISVNV